MAIDKKAEAEATLPAEAISAFRELIEDYKISAETHTGKVWVNYNILADLIRAGWRKGS